MERILTLLKQKENVNSDMSFSFPREKILVLVLLLSTALGYMEWGNGNHAFVLEAELEFFRQFVKNPTEIFSFIILLPLLGQVMMFIALFRKNKFNLTLLIAILFVSVLYLLIFLSGVLSLSPLIIFSTLPYFVLSGRVIHRIRAKRRGIKIAETEKK